MGRNQDDRRGRELGILGWGPLVAVVGLIAAAQGLLIGVGLTGAGGLLEYL